MTGEWGRLAAALLIGIALAAAGAGQEKTTPEAAKGAIQGRDDVAACVRGRIITAMDVKREAERLKKLAPEASRKALLWQARSMLAERILLAETAKSFAKDVTDEEVRRFFTRRGESLENINKNLDAFKESYIIELYFAARFGWTDRLPGVDPDMASYIRVTPGDIRSDYRNNLDKFTVKGRTRFLWFLFPASAFADPGERLDAARSCRKLLERPDANPKEIASRWPGCILKEGEVASGEKKKFHASLMDFVTKGKKGAVSPVIELEGGLIVARIVEKTRDVTRSFEDVQEQVSRELKNYKERNARRIIVEDLARREKLFWPPDLFNPAAGEKKNKSPIPAEGTEKSREFSND